MEEVKSPGNSVKRCEDNYVEFSSGNKYTFQDGKVYKNKTVVADKVSDCRFKLRTIEYKQIVSVYLEFSNSYINFTLGQQGEYSRTIDYVL